jgi:NAD(P)-dependent dehydrogenase (short-subunit alcohol dehydrogenase family)
MAARLDGKVALVTGATRGIGAAITRRLAQEGSAVVLSGRSEEQGREVEAQVRADGGRALFVRADVSDRQDVTRLVAEAVDHFGPLTTLVNNAARQDL